METTCLGDVCDQVNYSVECVNLKHGTPYNRNLYLLERLNLGGFYEFLKSISNALKLNYFFSSRPTILEYDSTTRQLFKSVKNMFSNKRRRVNYGLDGSPLSGRYRSSIRSSLLGHNISIGTATTGDCTNTMDNVIYMTTNVDFFVNDKNLVAVSPYEGGNLRVTTIPITPEFVPAKHTASAHSGYENVKNTNIRSYVVITDNDSVVTTLCINDFFGFGFEVFAGFADKSVCFFRVNTPLNGESMPETYDPSTCGCYNVTGYQYLDKVPTHSKFSPNRELVLVATKNSLYLLEKNGFDLEYDKLCELRSGSLVCADFLNDFEVMVLESNCLLTVYKKYNMKFSVYIRYNLGSLLTHLPNHSNPSVAANGGFSSAKSVSFGESRSVTPPNTNRVNSGTGSATNSARGFKNFSLSAKRNTNTSVKRVGKIVRDFNGNVYLLIKNTDLIKLTWNETLIPYSSIVSFQTPSNLLPPVNMVTNLSVNEHQNRLITDFNVENNLVAVTFRGSNLVHLYSLTSFKELNQLKPPKPDYLPKFVKSCSSDDCCFLLVLWTHTSNYYNMYDNYDEATTQRTDGGGIGSIGGNANNSTVNGSTVDGRYISIPYERDVSNTDILRSYKIKSTLTRCPKKDDVPFTTYNMGPSSGVAYPAGYNTDYNGNYATTNGHKEWATRKLPLLSSFHPKINNRYNTRWNDFNKVDDSFSNRRHLFGRSLSDHSLRQETIYSIDEFIRNRRV